MCKISVVTSVYNCEDYIAETIESIQKQTYDDWEFILIDDCSSDRSGDIIKQYAEKDSRIIYISNPVNQGQCRNLNKGIRLAKGEYIARLDHDDICIKDRLAKQLEYMESHTDCVLVGSWMYKWQDGQIIKNNNENVILRNEKETRFILLQMDVMPHSSFFIRKDAMTNNDIWYRETYEYAEDYGLISDLLCVGDVYVLQEALVIYRVFSDQLSQKCSAKIRRSERQLAILNYLEHVHIKDKGIYRLAIDAKLVSNNDYKRIEQFIYRYAYYCGLGDSKSEIRKQAIVRDFYYNMCVDQKKSRNLLFSYLSSSLCDIRNLLNTNGIRILAHCLLNHDGAFKHH